MFGIWRDKLKSISSNPGVHKYLGSTSWLLANKIASLIASLFIGIWLARYLGPKSYGEFNYVQSYVGLFAIVASLGLDSLIVRELLVKNSQRNEILGSALVLKIMGSFLLLFIIASIQIFTDLGPSNEMYVYLIVLSSFFNSFKIIEYYFISEVKGEFIAKANILVLLISSALKVFFILNNKELIYFFWLLVVDALLIAISYVIFYSKTVGKIKKWKFNSKIASDLLNDGWPLILSGFVTMVYMKVDQVMIKEFMDEESVGYYAVAARLSELWYFIPAIIADTFFPAIINVKNNTAEYNNRLKNLYSLMFYLAIAVAIPITIFGGFFIELLYGVEYLPSVTTLKIHVWSGIFVFIGYVFNKYLIAENYTKIAFYRTLIGAVANVILNLVLIPILGIIGAAIATLVSQMTTNYLFDLFNKKLFSQFILKTKAPFNFPKIS